MYERGYRSLWGPRASRGGALAGLPEARGIIWDDLVHHAVSGPYHSMVLCYEGKGALVRR